MDADAPVMVIHNDMGVDFTHTTSGPDCPCHPIVVPIDPSLSHDEDVARIQELVRQRRNN